MAVSAIHNGWRKPLDYTGSDLLVVSKGQTRFDIGNATLTQEGGSSSALLFGLGNSTTRAQTGAASAKFVSIYSEATADSTYGFYYRHYLATTAGISGDAARIYGTVQNIAAGTARGAHISLSMGTSGTVTGLGTPLECTLHIPSTAGQTGSLAAITLAINSDAATSDPAGATNLAYMRVSNQGDATGGADVDDDAYLISIYGHTEGAGNMIVASATEANYAHAARCYIDGVGEVWLMFASASG